MDCSPTKLLCPWDFPGRNTGVGCPFPFPGALPHPETEPMSPALADGFLNLRATWEDSGDSFSKFQLSGSSKSLSRFLNL